MQVVDTEGVIVAKGLAYSGAQALIDSWLAIDVEFGCRLRIKPDDEAPKAAPPIVFDLAPIVPVNYALDLPEIDRGAERDHLRECIARHAHVQQVYQTAQEAAARAVQHRVQCDDELSRLQAAGEAETAAAGAVLADRIKAGESAPLEPNLNTGRVAILDAVARRDAAIKACAVLDDEMAETRSHLDVERATMQKAADAVIHAELMQAVDKLEELWKQTMPLRHLLNSAQYAGFPHDQRTRAAMEAPEFFEGSMLHGRIVNYRQALMRDADACLADQPDRVTV